MSDTQQIKIHAYDPRVTMIQYTMFPANIVTQAAKTTQVLPQLEATMAFNSAHNKSYAQAELIEAIIHMGHTSVLEHAFITMSIDQISRGCANQLTRHRMGSFTQSSTHYTDHSDVNHYVSCLLVNDFAIRTAIETAMNSYIKSAKEDLPEARQVLPTSTEVKVLWTVNARALLNFLRIRLCNRNMEEMQKLAIKVYTAANAWFPDAFKPSTAYPDCHVGECKQGKMKCTRGYF